MTLKSPLSLARQLFVTLLLGAAAAGVGRGGQPVVARDPDDHREVRVTQVVLGVDQADPQVGDGRLVILLADAVADFAHLKHARLPLPQS